MKVKGVAEKLVVIFVTSRLDCCNSPLFAQRWRALALGLRDFVDIRNRSESQKPSKGSEAKQLRIYVLLISEHRRSRPRRSRSSAGREYSNMWEQCCMYSKSVTLLSLIPFLLNNSRVVLCLWAIVNHGGVVVYQAPPIYSECVWKKNNADFGSG